MADIKISQMTAGTPDENTLFEGSLDGGGGVYNTRSVSASALATLLNTTMQYGGLSTTDDTIVGSINEVSKDHNVSDEYDSTQTYVVGDLCIYGNNLYKCNTDITTPEPFDANKWTQTTLDAVIPRDADDIPYSSGVSVADKLDNVPTFDTLTTSDNNKLLGVSVSGDDISVGAVESITPISETVTYTNSSNLRMNITLKKLFNIVELSTAGPDGAMALPTAWTLVAELTNTQLFPTVNTGFAVTVDSATIFFNVYTDGKIYCFARGGSSIYVGGSHTRFY